jgi:cytidylate kinase
MSAVPVIAIDGPSGSGKGTVCEALARRLGWHLLDSGALYRLVALDGRRAGVDLDDAEGLAARALALDLVFEPAPGGGEIRVRLDGEDVSDAIRTDEVGQDASRVAALPAVREALVERQRAFAKAPGLIADGRDMGTVVFTDAPVKIFLTASAEARAERRYKQLMDKGLSANLAALLQSIRDRDERDASRSVAPLKPAGDALVIDSTGVPVADVIAEVLAAARRAGLIEAGDAAAT